MNTYADITPVFGLNPTIDLNQTVWYQPFFFCFNKNPRFCTKKSFHNVRLKLAFFTHSYKSAKPCYCVVYTVV